MDRDNEPELDEDRTSTDSGSGDTSPWLPDPVPAVRFHAESPRVNINRAPHDRVSGVVYKRAAHIKTVRYDLTSESPQQLSLPLTPNDAETGVSGSGFVDIRWLFSELDGLDEGLLKGRSFSYLQECILAPGAATAEATHADLATVICVLEGYGELAYRPSTGSPILVRTLRSGDAALIGANELVRLVNRSPDAPLRLVILGLQVG